MAQCETVIAVSYGLAASITVCDLLMRHISFSQLIHQSTYSLLSGKITTHILPKFIMLKLI